MNSKRSTSRVFFDLFNIALILALLIGSAASPTDASAANSISAQADSKSVQVSGKLMQPRVHQTGLTQGSKLQVVTFAPLADTCAACDQNLADVLAVCNQYDINVCGGDPACIAELSGLLDTCIADANAVYSSCTASCTLPDDDGGGGGDEGGAGGGGAEEDSDLDGITNSIDNCPSTANSNQFDVDGDGLGDVCDPFPLDTTNQDNDGDGVSELFDNCPSVANTDQSDIDGDGLGDVCDPTPNGLLDQTITVTISAPTSAIAGDEFTVEAIASSGLPVTYSASGSCSNADGTFTMNSGSSDCTVMYDQGGDESYNPATQVVEIVAGINSAPVVDEGESVTVTMSQDGTPNAFALTLHAGDQDLDSLNWSISSPASNGTATIPVKSKCDGKKPKNPKDPKLPCKDINYIPTVGYSGNDSFDVQVSDGDLTDTITVNVIIERTNTSVVTLINSQGNGLADATVQYYASGWHTIPGATDADGELSYEGLGLSGNLTFRITYANASIQKQQNITDDPTVIFQTQLANMQLLASDGSTELGGEAQYYSNGWRIFGSGSTSTSMELLPLNYTFRVSYGGASMQKQQNIGNDSAIIFQTKSVSMQLLASANTTELAGTSEYYANGWKTFGSGSTSATMELLPVNYTFRVSYGGASIQKQQDVNINSTVVFQTKSVSMQLLASNGTTELAGTSEYYANGWKTFGGGSTSATMELLPVNYTFRISYGGASIQKQQDVNTNAAVVFQTKLASMQLLASNGTTELAGMSEYYANGWKTFGNGSTTTTMELLPVSYTFRVTYGGAGVQKQQDVNTNSLIVFQTKLVTMKLLASNGTTELVGTSEYYANGWKTFGNGTTTTTMELLPVNYTFRVSYGGASVQKQQDANANQLVVFQTGQVHSNSAAATQYYANGWKIFVQNMELLPGSYLFKFSDGTPQTTYPLIAGAITSIH